MCFRLLRHHLCEAVPRGTSALFDCAQAPFRTGDEGKHTIQISFIDSDGKAILPEGGPRIEFTMGEPPAQAFFWSQNFIFNIAGLRLPSPGQYSLDVLYDGKIVSRIPLQGVQIQQPAQQG